MNFRFADLPVRIKFLVTLAIPVIGLMLLIGKQVDSSIKRHNVLGYISERSKVIEQISTVIDALQEERGLSQRYLTDVEKKNNRLAVQYTQTDDAIKVLLGPSVTDGPEIDMSKTFLGLAETRDRVVARATSLEVANRFYRGIDQDLIDDLGKLGKLAVDPEHKDRLYAHLSLISAKESLSSIRGIVGRTLALPTVSDDMAEFMVLAGNFSSNMALFERDAPPDLLKVFREEYSGEQIALLNSMIGTMKERRSLAWEGLDEAGWWQLCQAVTERLKAIEDSSIMQITDRTEENLSWANWKLVVSLIALLVVLSTVTILGFLTARGIRRTVDESISAAEALSKGAIMAKVPVRSEDEFGKLAKAFNDMMDNVRSLASSADLIGKGNYDTNVRVRSEDDVLGLALTRMKDNLKAAKERDEYQSRVLQEEKEKLQKANEQINVLIKEIHHRVKNNLQVVASLLRLQGNNLDDPRLQRLFEQSQSRVTSMALIHEKLYKGAELARLNVANYLEELFVELVHVNDVSEQIKYRTDIPADLELDLNTMVPLGLLLNELITNSFKHAFRGREGGLVDLALHPVESGTYELNYVDDGVGMPETHVESADGTLGVTLIDSLVEQLNGIMTVDSNNDGTRYKIRFKER